MSSRVLAMLFCCGAASLFSAASSSSLRPQTSPLSFDGEIWDFSPERAQAEVILGVESSSMFGYSISVYDERLVVGAMGNYTGRGAAYVYFRMEDGVWRLDKELVLQDAAKYDQFGCAVAIYDYTVVIGANKRDGLDDFQTDAGAAYIYEKLSGRWELVMDLTPDDSTMQDYFGSAVAIYRNTTVVGCWGCDSMGSFSGAAYVYSLWDGEWVFNEKIFADDGSRYNWFGISVAIHSNLIVVGATGVVSTSTLEKTGGAYVFCNVRDERKYDGFRYVECAQLLPGDGQDGDAFGTSVAVHDGVVVVGAPRADFKHGQVMLTDAGTVYMYYQDTSSDFHYLQKMSAYEPSLDGHYGNAVDIYEDIVVVGGYNSSGMGAAFIYGENYKLSTFDKNTNAFWQLAFITTAKDEADGDNYGFAVSVYNATLVVGCHGMDASKSVNGVTKQLPRAGGVFSYWAGLSKITVPNQYTAIESEHGSTGWIFGISAVAALVLGVAGFFAYKKNLLAVLMSDNNADRFPISDWLPSSFSKAFGSEEDGAYTSTALDSSHGSSSSHGMISSGAVNSTTANNDKLRKVFDADDIDKDEQMLDDSLAKFQLKRQNRISIKKKGK